MTLLVLHQSPMSHIAFVCTMYPYKHVAFSRFYAHYSYPEFLHYSFQKDTTLFQGITKLQIAKKSYYLTVYFDKNTTIIRTKLEQGSRNTRKNFCFKNE